jgi:hypothetical protein
LEGRLSGSLPLEAIVAAVALGPSKDAIDRGSYFSKVVMYFNVFPYRLEVIHDQQRFSIYERF